MKGGYMETMRDWQKKIGLSDAEEVTYTTKEKPQMGRQGRDNERIKDMQYTGI